MNNTELFSSKSDDYSRFRPGYPISAVNWLKSKTSGEAVIDIGAGTGIFTELLLKRFSNVSAIEPNAAMREKFSSFLPDIICHSTTGENTALPDNSVDLITVAQAFHWLDEEQFKREAMRILKPSGKVAIIWNTTQRSDFTDSRNAICQKYCPRFKSGYAGKRTPQEGDAFLRYSYFKTVEFVSFDNPFVMDQPTFEGNIRSRSYALLPGDRQYDGFMAEQRAVFERFAENGTVTELQETQIYLGCFN